MKKSTFPVNKQRSLFTRELAQSPHLDLRVYEDIAMTRKSNDYDVPNASDDSRFQGEEKIEP